MDAAAAVGDTLPEVPELHEQPLQPAGLPEDYLLYPVADPPRPGTDAAQVVAAKRRARATLLARLPCRADWVDVATPAATIAARAPLAIQFDSIEVRDVLPPAVQLPRQALEADVAAALPAAAPLRRPSWLPPDSAGAKQRSGRYGAWPSWATRCETLTSTALYRKLYTKAAADVGAARAAEAAARRGQAPPVGARGPPHATALLYGVTEGGAEVAVEVPHFMPHLVLPLPEDLQYTAEAYRDPAVAAAGETARRGWLGSLRAAAAAEAGVPQARVAVRLLAAAGHYEHRPHPAHPGRHADRLWARIYLPTVSAWRALSRALDPVYPRKLRLPGGGYLRVPPQAEARVDLALQAQDALGIVYGETVLVTGYVPRRGTARSTAEFELWLRLASMPAGAGVPNVEPERLPGAPPVTVAGRHLWRAEAWKEAGAPAQPRTTFYRRLVVTWDGEMQGNAGVLPNPEQPSNRTTCVGVTVARWGSEAGAYTPVARVVFTCVPARPAPAATIPGVVTVESPSEAAMLDALRDYVVVLTGGGVVLGYNNWGFDDRYFARRALGRCARWGHLGRWLADADVGVAFEKKLQSAGMGFLDVSILCSDRSALDVQHFLRTILNLGLDSYKLEAVSRRFLKGPNAGKDPLDSKVHVSRAAAPGAHPLAQAKVVKYCARDCDVTLAVAATKRALETVYAQCRAMSLGFSKLTSGGQGQKVTAVMYRYAHHNATCRFILDSMHKDGHVTPGKGAFSGGTVIKPLEPTLYAPVAGAARHGMGPTDPPRPNLAAAPFPLVFAPPDCPTATTDTTITHQVTMVTPEDLAGLGLEAAEAAAAADAAGNDPTGGADEAALAAMEAGSDMEDGEGSDGGRGGVPPPRVAGAAASSREERGGDSMLGRWLKRRSAAATAAAAGGAVKKRDRAVAEVEQAMARTRLWQQAYEGSDEEGSDPDASSTSSDSDSDGDGAAASAADGAVDMSMAAAAVGTSMMERGVGMVGAEWTPGANEFGLLPLGVLVCLDFASLYPTIVMAHNTDDPCWVPPHWVPVLVRAGVPVGYTTAPNGTRSFWLQHFADWKTVTAKRAGKEQFWRPNHTWEFLPAWPGLAAPCHDDPATGASATVVGNDTLTGPVADTAFAEAGVGSRPQPPAPGKQAVAAAAAGLPAAAESGAAALKPAAAAAAKAAAITSGYVMALHKWVVGACSRSCARDSLLAAVLHEGPAEAAPTEALRAKHGRLVGYARRAAAAGRWRPEPLVALRTAFTAAADAAAAVHAAGVEAALKPHREAAVEAAAACKAAAAAAEVWVAAEKAAGAAAEEAAEGEVTAEVAAAATAGAAAAAASAQQAAAAAAAAAPALDEAVVAAVAVSASALDPLAEAVAALAAAGAWPGTIHMRRILPPRFRYRGDAALMAIVEDDLFYGRKAVKARMEAAYAAGDAALGDALNAEQLALKIIMNSMFGTKGAKAGALRFVEVAQAITTLGGLSLRQCVKFMETTYAQYGAWTAYGDTDSVFIYFRDCSPRQVAAAAEELESALTGLFPSPMEMELEKMVLRAIFLRAKRYIMDMIEMGGDALRAAAAAWEAGRAADARIKRAHKGVKLKRRDNTRITRTVLGAAVEAVMTLAPAGGEVAAVLSARRALQPLLEDALPLEAYVSTSSIKPELQYKPGYAPNPAIAAVWDVVRRAMGARGDTRQDARLGEPLPGDRVQVVVTTTADPTNLIPPPGRLEMVAASLAEAPPAGHHFATGRKKNGGGWPRGAYARDAEVVAANATLRPDRVHVVRSELQKELAKILAPLKSAVGAVCDEVVAGIQRWDDAAGLEATTTLPRRAPHLPPPPPRRRAPSMFQLLRGGPARDAAGVPLPLDRLLDTRPPALALPLTPTTRPPPLLRAGDYTALLALQRLAEGTALTLPAPAPVARVAGPLPPDAGGANAAMAAEAQKAAAAAASPPWANAAAAAAHPQLSKLLLRSVPLIDAAAAAVAAEGRLWGSGSAATAAVVAALRGHNAVVLGARVWWMVRVASAEALEAVETVVQSTALPALRAALAAQGRPEATVAARLLQGAGVLTYTEWRRAPLRVPRRPVISAAGIAKFRRVCKLHLTPADIAGPVDVRFKETDGTAKAAAKIGRGAAAK